MRVFGIGLSLFFAGALVFGSGCSRSDGTTGGNGHNDAGTVGDDGGTPIDVLAECPVRGGGELTVCDLKLAGGARQPAIDAVIAIRGVVVTTKNLIVAKNGMTDEITRAGFYVQDADDTSGQFAGILVTYAPADIASPPSANDVVDIDGFYSAYAAVETAPKQLQIRATHVTASGRQRTVAPHVVDDLSVLGNNAVSQAYEGALLRVNDVEATKLRLPSQTGDPMQFVPGFEVDGRLIVSTWIASYRATEMEEFASITGIYRLGTNIFESGLYLLTPRTADDIVSTSSATGNALTTIPEIRRATHCRQDGSSITGTCANARLHDVVVTAAGGYVSQNLRALWVQDGTIADGRNAGLKVVYAKDAVGFVPEAGDRIGVEGQIIRYYGGLQIGFPTFTRGTGTATIAPIVVAPSEIARGSDPERNEYEGVLVRIEDVTVVSACVEDRNHRDHGNWTVTGDVFLGTAFFYDYNGDLPSPTPSCTNQGGASDPCSCDAHPRENDLRRVGDEFRAIVGVTNYAFDDFRLEPRGAFDLDRL